MIIRKQPSATFEKKFFTSQISSFELLPLLDKLNFCKIFVEVTVIRNSKVMRTIFSISELTFLRTKKLWAAEQSRKDFHQLLIHAPTPVIGQSLNNQLNPNDMICNFTIQKKYVISKMNDDFLLCDTYFRVTSYLLLFTSPSVLLHPDAR